MINTTRPILNLDLDLLRTFVAVADLNTFAAAAAAVCRTQSAVSQQMQRLEQLVGKELFARHGRNKLLTEQGIQLLGYARKILRFNDEACMSLMYGSLQGALSIGASEETDENDKEAIGTLSKADQADIYSIIENSASLTYSLQVQPTRLLELNNDHSAVEGYSQDMFIDYYNTYTPETYNLQDIIDKLHAEETSDSIRSLSQDQLIQLTNEKKDGWIYSTKDKAFYEIVAGGRGGAMPPMEIPSPDEWVINEDSVEVTTTIQGTSDPYRRFVLKRNNKNYKGGTHKTRFYVDSTEFVKS